MSRYARRSLSPVVLSVVAAALLSTTATSAWQPSKQTRDVLNAAKQRDPSVPAQAAALIRLAWGDGPESTPLVRAAARAELAGFGKHALRPLRLAFKEIEPRYQADAVAVFLEARFKVRSELPSDFLAGLDEFLYFGSREARRLAMVELARYSFPPAVLTLVDAVYDDPALIEPAFRTLASLRDDRATMFLARALRDDDERLARLAARAMGAIGGRAKTALRDLAAADAAQPELRRRAIDGLLAAPRIDDLTVLHEFIGDHLDSEGDALVDRARLVAADLELRLERAADDDDGF